MGRAWIGTKRETHLGVDQGYSSLDLQGWHGRVRRLLLYLSRSITWKAFPGWYFVLARVTIHLQTVGLVDPQSDAPSLLAETLPAMVEIEVQVPRVVFEQWPERQSESSSMESLDRRLELRAELKVAAGTSWGQWLRSREI